MSSDVLVEYYCAINWYDDVLSSIISLMAVESPLTRN